MTHCSNNENGWQHGQWWIGDLKYAQLFTLLSSQIKPGQPTWNRVLNNTKGYTLYKDWDPRPAQF